MSREIEEPTKDERGQEHHPAWAMLGASRVQQGPDGAVLFDSEVRHNHYVVVKLSTASRKRDLSRDWLMAERQVVEVAMSEAQWASFVSSMNAGDGVPCTLLAREGDWNVPGMPYAPRLQESMKEVRGAADEALAEVQAAFAAYAEKKSAANLNTLKYAIANASPNMEFAAKSLTEHAENVVQKARVDIEAIVTSKAKQLGVAPDDLGIQAQLPEGA